MIPSPLYVYLTAILCVLGIAAGQVLFKMSAAHSQAAANFFDQRSLTYLLSALVIYGFATIAWVWVLRFAELGRIYPLMALAFVIVPLASYFFFGERFHWQYYLGVALIVLGVMIVSRT